MTTANVVICGCGHAERLHEKDEAAEHGRGVCFKGGCGCSEMQPATAVATDPRPALDLTAPEPAAPATARPFVCPDCPETFATPQARGAHRRYKHLKPPTGAKEGPHADRDTSPAVTPDAPPVRATESGTPTTQVTDDDEAPGRAGTPAAGDKATGRGPTSGSSSTTAGNDAGAASTPAAPANVTTASYALVAHYDFGDAGRVDVHADQLTHADLLVLLDVLTPLTQETR